jgi:hypothetical protein
MKNREPSPHHRVVLPTVELGYGPFGVTRRQALKSVFAAAGATALAGAPLVAAAAAA